MPDLEAPQFREISGDDLSPELVDAMLGVLTRAFGRWPRLDPEIDPEAYLRWKYAEKPTGVRVVLAEIDGKLVGMHAIHRQPWLVRGVLRYARVGIDLAIDPDYQGRGIYRAMSKVTDQIRDGYDFVISFSVLPQTIAVTKSQGARFIANQVRALHRAGESRGKGKPTVGGVALGMAAFAGKAGCRLSTSSKSTDVKVAERFDERVTRLVELAAGQLDLVQLRDAAHMNWRYTDPRAGNFTIIQAEEGPDLVGYAVVNSTHDDASIADLLTLPGRVDVAHSLLDASIANVESSRPRRINAWLPRKHPYARVYRAHGFLVARDRPTGAAYRTLAMEPAQLTFLDDEAARIHIMAGNTDEV